MMTIKSANACTTWACHNAGGQQQPPHCHADLSLVKWFTTVPLQPFFVILVPGCGPKPQTNMAGITELTVHRTHCGPNLWQIVTLQA